MPETLIPVVIMATVMGIFGAWLKLSDRESTRPDRADEKKAGLRRP